MKTSNIIISIYVALVIVGILISFIFSKFRIGEIDRYAEERTEAKPVIPKEVRLNSFNVIVIEGDMSVSIIESPNYSLYVSDEENYTSDMIRTNRDTLFVKNNTSWDTKVYIPAVETIIVNKNRAYVYGFNQQQMRLIVTNGYILMDNDTEYSKSDKTAMGFLIAELYDSELEINDVQINSIHVDANKSSVTFNHCDVKKIRADLKASHVTCYNKITDGIFNADKDSYYRVGY